MESIINDLKYNQTKEVSLIIQDINTGQIVGITATKKNEIIEAIKTNSYGGFIIKEILLTENSKAVLYLVDSKDSINNLNYRTIDNKEVSASLTKENIMETVAKLLIDRKKDIENKDSYASSLFKDGLGKILEKIDEESKESIEASETGDKDKIVYEYTDLFFHMLVALTEHGLTIEDIYSEFKRRFGKKKKDYTLDE
jgi:phosphoribosyl-ATP pyrophosphohydrolase